MNFLRFAAVLLVASAAAYRAPGASSPLSADQASVLASAQEYALQYTKNLPNFICTQITHRDTSSINSRSMGVLGVGVPGVSSVATVLSDTIEEKLTYLNQKEHYAVVAINGKKVSGVQHIQIAGAVSSGEFGSALHEIFDPLSHMVFTWDRIAKLRGRRAYIFAFQVPRDAGTRVFDKESGQEVSVPYIGRIFVDPDTKEVMRITTHLDLPLEFPIKVAERIVDYKPTNIAGKNYNLPFHSEVLMQDRTYLYVNKIDFKAYQRFAVESTIRYGSFAEQSPPEATLESPNATVKATGGQSSPVTSTPAEPVAAAQQQSPPVANMEAPPPAAPSTAAQFTAEQKTPQAAPSVGPVTQATGGTMSAIQPQPKAVSNVEPPQTTPMNAADTSFRLDVRVDLVIVPVVVRNEKGQPVGNLTQEDFQLFDKGKRQKITSFTLEKQGGSTAEKEAPGSTPGTAPGKAPEESSPTNFVVYLFDDVNLKFGDLAQVQEAAARHMDTLQATDQAAILTTSGLVELQFTNDHANLHYALLKLRAQPLSGPAVQGCPDVSYYQADQMLNRYPLDLSNNPALQAATDEAIACMNVPVRATAFAMNQAINAARRAEAVGEHESRGVLLAIRDVVRWVSHAPGKKSIILVSPGFILTTDLQIDEAEVIDQAIRGDVVISALDARGLYTLNPAGDVGQRSFSATATRIKADIARQELTASSGVLEEMAAGTGGNFVQNTNDLYGGFQRLATSPEYTYLLGFKPGILNMDGSFHPLKVKLNTREKLNLQARRGYYAAKK